MEFVIVIVLGLLVLIAVLLGYFLLGGFSLDPSLANTDWGAFGSYFGGLAGPLLTFISVILIVYTVRQQRLQFKSMAAENLKQDMLRYLGELDNEIAHLLTREIHTGNNRYVELGDLVAGISSPTDLHEQPYRAAMDKLLRLTANYCEAIALYRNNVNSNFVFRAHQQRAEELVTYLKQNIKYLYRMAGPTLAVCEINLKGTSEIG